MAVSRIVVLLRGINVGGHNRILMADLRETLTDAGYRDVETYIQSGNVLLTAPNSTAARAESDIEALLEERFGLPIRVVARTHQQLAAVVTDAPRDFLDLGDTHLLDAIFLKSPLSVDEAMGALVVRDGVDAAWPGEGVLYGARLEAERGRSGFSKLVSTPQYQSMTIRNWKTTTTLLGKLDDG